MMKLKQIIIPTIALFIICAITSFALAGTNAITKKTILESQNKALEQTLFTSVPDADDFESLTTEGGNKYYQAYKDKNLIAYIIETSAKGYGGNISVLTAISADGEILKVTVTDASSETTGIGSKVTEDSFLNQFKGYDSAADTITGATYSSKGVKQAVQNAMDIFKEIGGGV